MKLETLASVLKKDATELATALNVADGETEVSDDLAKKELDLFYNQLAIEKLSEGKKQEEGKAKRIVTTDLERKLKETFGVDGANFDEIIGNIAKPAAVDDSKTKKDLDVYKAKATELETKYNDLLTKQEKSEMSNKVLGTLGSVIDTFTFATPKVKEIAISNFVNSYNFEDSENGIYAKVDDRIIIDINGLATKHFKDYGSEKTPEKKPKLDAAGDPIGAKNIKDLLASIPSAKTAEERAEILAEIKRLEAKGKD